MEPPLMGLHPGVANACEPDLGPVARGGDSNRRLRVLRDGHQFHGRVSDRIFFGASFGQEKIALSRFDHRSVLGQLSDAHARMGQFAQ